MNKIAALSRHAWNTIMAGLTGAGISGLTTHEVLKKQGIKGLSLGLSTLGGSAFGGLMSAGAYHQGVKSGLKHVGPEIYLRDAIIRGGAKHE